MSSTVDEPRASRRAYWVAPALAARLRPALPLIAVTILAIILRLLIVTATDVSWLITLSEKVLDGTRLYVDLIEVNPPASVLLYLPAVALARLIGVAPEIVVNTLVFFAVGASLWITGRILGGAAFSTALTVDLCCCRACASIFPPAPLRSASSRGHCLARARSPRRAQGIFPGLSRS